MIMWEPVPCRFVDTTERLVRIQGFHLADTFAEIIVTVCCSARDQS
jgi:hypothetical protein